MFGPPTGNVRRNATLHHWFPARLPRRDLREQPPDGADDGGHNGGCNLRSVARVADSSTVEHAHRDAQIPRHFAVCTPRNRPEARKRRLPLGRAVCRHSDRAVGRRAEHESDRRPRTRFPRGAGQSPQVAGGASRRDCRSRWEESVQPRAGWLYGTASSPVPITIFPRACPCPWYLRASGTPLKA
jgi:hypothetical protein